LWLFLIDNMKSFKPTKIGKDTTIEFTLDDNSVVIKTIANLPIEDEDGKAFKKACKEYGRALERAMKKKESKASKKVLAMKGKKQTIKKEIKK